MSKQEETRRLITFTSKEWVELLQFPYVKEEETKEKHEFVAPCYHYMYDKEGHRVKQRELIANGYRFDTYKVTMINPEGSEYSHTVTLSKPSAEVICLKKERHQVYVYLILQPRTPYVATAQNEDNKWENYARFFLEEPAGLVENGETFEDAARREVEEEVGYRVKKLVPLMAPSICRHVSYSDETSQVFVAKLGKRIEQKLDENEFCKVQMFPVEMMEMEFENYLEGIKDNFYGFDLPEMTIMALQRFFVKWHRGDFNGFFTESL